MTINIKKIISAFLISTTIATLIINNISPKQVHAIEREFVRATAGELTNTLIADGKTWTKNSAVTEKTEFFPEIRFDFGRDIEVAYYGQWIPENADGTIGHFEFGVKSNYWLYEDDGTGKQKGYNVWEDHSIPHVVIYYLKGTDGTGSDFFNNYFTTQDANGLEYSFRTGSSFLNNVEFYAKKETIEAFLRSIYDPDATFNVTDYVKSAKLEDRMKRPSDPKNPSSTLIDSPAGIVNGIYIDVLKSRPEIKLLSANGSTRPSLADSNWKIETDADGNKKYYYCTGKYGNQKFNYYSPSRNEIIGYKATYTSEGEDEVIPPVGGGEGSITFTPSSTPWTNTGKPTGFPVQVSATGQNITHKWVQHYTKTTYVTPWIPQTGHTDATGKYIVDSPAHWGTTSTSTSDVPVSYDVKYTMGNITISGGATPTSLPNTGGQILVPEGGYRNLSASATYTQQKGTPVAPTGSLSAGPNGTSIAMGALDQVPPPTNPTANAGTYNVDYTDPVLSLENSSIYWRNTPWNVAIFADDRDGQYVASGRSGLQSATYNVSDSSHYGRSRSNSFSYNSSIPLIDGIYSISLNDRDVAGNTNSTSDATYYVDITLPESDFSVKVNESVNIYH